MSIYIFDQHKAGNEKAFHHTVADLSTLAGIEETAEAICEEANDGLPTGVAKVLAEEALGLAPEKRDAVAIQLYLRRGVTILTLVPVVADAGDRIQSIGDGDVTTYWYVVPQDTTELEEWQWQLEQELDTVVYELHTDLYNHTEYRHLEEAIADAKPGNFIVERPATDRYGERTQLVWGEYPPEEE